MAKKKSASGFNMSEAVRALLQENSKIGLADALDVISGKHPSEKINKNSFSVAFYNSRNKLGIKSARGKKGGAKGMKRAAASMASSAKIDMHALQTAAKFLSEVGGADAALAAIKQVQLLQVK